MRARALKEVLQEAEDVILACGNDNTEVWAQTCGRRP